MKHYFMAIFNLLSVLSAISQIKVDTNGKVGIGTLVPTNGFGLTVKGNTNFRSPENESILQLNSVYNWFDLSPNSGNETEGNIGTNFPFESIVSRNGWFASAYIVDFTQGSDKRFKKNIQRYKVDLDKFNLLLPTQYSISDSLILAKKYPGQKIKPYTCDNSLGFIAQEVEEIFPNLVVEDSVTGFLSIKSLQFIPIIVSVCQQQQQQIAILNDRISALEKTLKK